MFNLYVIVIAVCAVANESSAPPVDSRGYVIAPEGYSKYTLEGVEVPKWQGCGHPDWGNPDEWMYSLCDSNDSLKCDSQGDPSWWACVPFQNTPVPGGVQSELCSCCKNSCASSLTYSCFNVTRDDCIASGPAYVYCESSSYDPVACEQLTMNDTMNWWRGTINPGISNWPSRLFAPYMDAGLYPFPKLSDIARESGVYYFGLGFVVGRKSTESSDCVPSIGGIVDFRTGPTSWNEISQSNDYLFDEIMKLREMGGDVFLSFGGAMGTELADISDCTSPNGDISALVDAYSSAIDTIGATWIDFDIEGSALTLSETSRHRFKAIKLLKIKYPMMRVSFTLPILPTGLTGDGLAFVELMFQSQVPWDIVNVMTMDFGGETVCPRETGVNAQSVCEIAAIESLAKQLYSVAKKTGVDTTFGWESPDSVYPKLGTTPMIGLNDITYEKYFIDDAKASLDHWMSSKPVGLISMWSVTRDHPCNASYVDTACSSAVDGVPIQSSHLEFSRIFAEYTSFSMWKHVIFVDEEPEPQHLNESRYTPEHNTRAVDVQENSSDDIPVSGRHYLKH